MLRKRVGGMRRGGVGRGKKVGEVYKKGGSGGRKGEER
jgi:hypothetical protein